MITQLHKGKPCNGYTVTQLLKGEECNGYMVTQGDRVMGIWLQGGGAGRTSRQPIRTDANMIR